MFFNIKERRIVLNRPVQLTENNFDYDLFSLKYKENQQRLPELPLRWKHRLRGEHEDQMRDYSKRKKNGYNESLRQYMNEFVFSTLHRPEWLQELELTMTQDIEEKMNYLATQTINEYIITGKHKEHVTIRDFYDDCKHEYTFNIPIHWYDNGTFAIASHGNEGLPMGYCFLKFTIDQYNN